RGVGLQRRGTPLIVVSQWAIAQIKCAAHRHGASLAMLDFGMRDRLVAWPLRFVQTLKAPPIQPDPHLAFARRALLPTLILVIVKPGMPNKHAFLPPHSSDRGIVLRKAVVRGPGHPPPFTHQMLDGRGAPAGVLLGIAEEGRGEEA